MTGPREPKKSETLEVRIPHEVKRALMYKAHSEGRSASEIVRGSIDSYLAQQVKEKPSMIALWKPAAVLGATATAALWTALASAPLHAKVDLKAAFEALDANHDGAISAEEFVAHKIDPSMMEKMGPCMRRRPTRRSNILQTSSAPILPRSTQTRTDQSLLASSRHFTTGWRALTASPDRPGETIGQ